MGKTCPMQPGWVGVLALCVPGWNDSSWDYCERLSKEKRLFSSQREQPDCLTAVFPQRASEYC